MNFLTLGDPGNKTVLFFHAMGVTGESSLPVARYLEKDHFIILPTLSAYCPGETMISKEDETEQLIRWLEEHGISEIRLLVASSLGADFAMTFLSRWTGKVYKAFFDGGQFAHIGAMTRKIMIPFLYLTIKSLYWSNGRTLKQILWCDDEEIKPYFIQAGKNLDYASMKAMMRDCLTKEPFINLPQDFQKNCIFEFGNLEEHFKYRDSVMKAYPYARFPVFEDMNHMQLQIRDPKGFAQMLKNFIDETGDK